MPTIGPIVGTAVGRSGVTLLARVLGQNGQPITQASMTSITYRVRDLYEQTTTSAYSLTISDVVFDELQTSNPRWTRDRFDYPGPDGGYGYNFAATIPAARFSDTYDVDSDSGRVTRHPLQIDVLFTPASGEPFVVPFVVTPHPVYHTG